MNWVDIMSELGEWGKVLGINGGIIATTSLAEWETGAKILVLLLTAAWTAVKIWRLVRGDDDASK